jgi:Mn-containing catalase
VAYQFWNMSVGEESGQGRWAAGPTPDGTGQFEYLANPSALGPVAQLGPGDPRLHSTNPMPGLMQRAVNKLST